MLNKSIVPVVMFHSVGLNKTGWIKHLCEPLQLFEEKLLVMKRAGYQFIFWADLYDYMTGKRTLKLPAIMLTFDDGYLDNWVYAFPLLKKHGIKATIFVNPEFVDEKASIRPAVETISSVTIDQAAGFLSWSEMLAMKKSGLVDIQSHAMTHTWYFSGEKLVDFHHPGDRYKWLSWNERTDLKPYYMSQDTSQIVPYGAPVFEFEKALVCRRFYPNEEMQEALSEFVASQNGSFFDKPDWRKLLREEFGRVKKKIKTFGRYESEYEYRKRIQGELEESKKIISEQLDKEVSFICWPGGGYNQYVLKAAHEAGYKAWTLASIDKTDFRNTPGKKAHQIKRISSCTHRYCKKTYIGYGSAHYFFLYVKAHQGDVISKIQLKWSQFAELLKVKFGSVLH